MFSNNPALNFKTFFDNTGCRCVKRLFFCGYNYITTGDGVKNQTSYLQPGRFVGPIRHTSGGKPEEEQYTGLMRQYVLEQLVLHNPIIQAQIQERRLQSIKSAIIEATVRNTTRSLLNNYLDSNFNPKEWKIVGLAQRTSRRRWMELPGLLDYCNQRFIPKRIICIEVNIEKEEFSNPVQHLLSHSILDVLIGIHGAQLTEALLMPHDALVVELLPWIYPGIRWGSWTRWVHRPTPLGVLFSGSSLNHIGYPLPRTSAKGYCEKDYFRRKCFERTPNAWDNRDFRIEKGLLTDILEKFVVMSSSLGVSSATCQDIVNAAGDEYVLYNINCVVPSGEKELLHYYRDQNWAEKKTNWTKVDELRLLGGGQENLR
jgi:hypothetical protein